MEKIAAWCLAPHQLVISKLFYVYFDCRMQAVRNINQVLNGIHNYDIPWHVGRQACPCP
jgi:hypothetical protein